MAQIKLTKQEAQYVILKAFGFQAEYRADVDLCITPHTLEITDGSQRQLEKSPGSGE